MAEVVHGSSWSRRDFLKAGGGLVAAGALGSVLSPLGNLIQSAGASTDRRIGEVVEPKKMVHLPFGYQVGYDYGLFYIMNELNWFEKEKVSLGPFSIFASGTPEIEALGTGGVDVAVLGFVPVMTAAATGAFPIRVIGVVANGARNYALVSNGSITSVPDLVGKTVGVQVGTNYEFYLDRVLDKYGMTESQLDIVNEEPADSQAAFLSGNLDALVPATVDTPLILADVPGSKILFDSADFANKPNPSKPFAIYDLIVTTQPQIDQHWKALGAMLNVFYSNVKSFVLSQKTRATAVQDIVTWQADVVKVTVTPSQVETSLSGYDFYDRTEAFDVMTKGPLAAQLHSAAVWMAHRGVISTVPSTAGVISTGPISLL